MRWLVGVGGECEFLRANPAHFVAFGLVLAWIWLFFVAF
nr:MAG TPA: hypothetical protein [Caudoviricetes sp.]